MKRVRVAVPRPVPAVSRAAQRLRWPQGMLEWMPGTRLKPFWWPRTMLMSSSHRVDTRPHPRYAVLLRGRMRRVSWLYQSQTLYTKTQGHKFRPTKRLATSFTPLLLIFVIGGKNRLDRRNEGRLLSSVTRIAIDFLTRAYLSAISAALLQCRRFQVGKATRADTLATRLSR